MARLSDLGLNSLGTVRLVMDIEDTLGISIPDELLVMETFASAEALWSVIAGLGEWESVTP
jgi:acyl carrier protein